MAIPSDPDDRQNWLAKQWHEYGKTFSAFVPEEQHCPSRWDPELPDIQVRSPQWLRKEF
jgi:hypothetical protein